MRIAARTPPVSPATAAALLVGMLLASRLPTLPPAWLILLLLAGASWLFCRARRLARIAAAAVFGFALLSAQGAWRLSTWLPQALEQQEFVVTGRIEALPLHEPRRSRFDLRVEHDPQLPQALRGRLLRVSWYPPYGQDEASAPVSRWQVQAGERWRLTLRLRAPHGLRNPGGFDAERQMLIDGVSANGIVCMPDRAQRLSPPRGIEAWRERMSARILADTDSPAARFVAALALGDTRGLQQEDWHILRATGLTHLIAISGFHVGMVGIGAAWLAWLLYLLVPALGRRLPRRSAMALAALAGSFLYLLATGASLPTVRTVLMIGFVAGAALLRRQGSVAQTVAAALIAILLLDPLAVLRPGFWLSFGGVVWLAWCLQSTRAGQVRQFVLAQLVVSLGLLPLTVALFGQASAVAPFANLIAVPWWSLLVVPLAILGTIAECLQPGWGAPLWTLAGRVFEPGWPWFTRAAEAPLALWYLPEPAWFAVPLALLAALAWLLPRPLPGRVLAGSLWLPLLWPHAPPPATGEVELVQLDVGQGSAYLLRTHRHALLFDAGPAVEQGHDAGERVVLPAMHALGLRRLSRVVVSHADNDHAGGLAAVVRAFPEVPVLAPDGAELPAATPCVAGDEWEWDGVRFRFLHPSAHFPYLKNLASCVLRVEGRHGALLLTGDIDELIEARLLRLDADALRADVVSVPHHGSASSSTAAFVTATAAQLALVSAGHGNRFGHPRAEVLTRWQEAGAATAISHQHGALRVRLNAEGIQVQSERSRRARFWDIRRRPQLSYRPLRTPPQETR